MWLCLWGVVWSGGCDASDVAPSGGFGGELLVGRPLGYAAGEHSRAEYRYSLLLANSSLLKMLCHGTSSFSLCFKSTEACNA